MRVGVPGTLLLIVAQAAQGLPAARAQEIAPASQPESQPADEETSGLPPVARQPFHLNIADLWIGMESDYEVRRVRSVAPAYNLYQRRASTQENREFRLEEKMGISLTGDLYDPNLFDYRASLVFGFDQDRYKEKSDWLHQSDSDSGGLFEWDVSADILKSKPVSFNVYTRRADVRVPRQFLPSLHEQQTEAGASALAVTGNLTTEIGFSYNDTETHNNQVEADDETVNLHRFYMDSKWAISDSQSLHLSYDHGREKDDYQGSLYKYSTSRDELRLDHEWAFGDKKQHRLDTYFLYNTEKGDLALDQMELVPRLTLQHTDKFKTVYRYGYYSFDQGDVRVDQNKMDVEALYQATKELRLSADSFGLHERLDNDVDTNQYGISGDATYQKTTSSGDFSADLNLGYDQARTSGSAGRRVVRNEAHALGGVRPVVLRERNVVIMSIIAHDERLTKVFVPNVDFAIVPVGDHIQITRIPWGRIAENDVVYFDYQYEISANSRINTYRMDFRIEHAFKFGLTPYYYYEGRSQEVDASSFGTPSYRDNQDRHRFGLRYRKERWTVTGEYEIFDDTVEPYNAFHFTGQMNLLRNIDHSLDVRGEISRYWFEGGNNYYSYYNKYYNFWYVPEDDRRRVWFIDFDIKDRITINDYLSWTTGAELRHEDDSVRGKTEGIDFETGIQYTRGALTVELTMEYDLLNVVSNRENGFGIFLNVKRDLSYLVPPNLRGGSK